MLKIFPLGEGQKLFGGKSRFVGKTQSIYSVAKNSLMGKTLVIVVKGKKTNSGWAVNLAQPVMAGESGEEEKKKNNKQSTLNRSQIKKKQLCSLHRVQMHDRLSWNN